MKWILELKKGVTKIPLRRLSVFYGERYSSGQYPLSRKVDI